MKRWINYVYVLILIVSITACDNSVKDEPFPYSKQNAEKASKEMKEALESFSPLNDPKNDTNRLIALCKMVFEEELNYSFDKTLRGVMLAHAKGFDARYHFYYALIPGLVSILDDPKNALEQGFISQRTYDIMEVFKVGGNRLLNDLDIELLGFVRECQSKNNGICDTGVLWDILVISNKQLCDKSMEEESSYYKTKHGGCVSNELSHKYMAHELQVYTTPDGKKEFNSNFMIRHRGHAKFIINTKKLDSYEDYRKIVEEERKTLFPQK